MFNLVDLVRRLVRERVDEVRGVVANIHGAVAGESPPLEIGARQDWLWTKVPSRSLLPLADFYTLLANTSGLETVVVSGREGLVRVEGAQLTHFLRGMVVSAGDEVVPMRVEVFGAGAEASVYVNGVLQRRSPEALQLFLRLEAGTNLIEVLTFSDAATVRIPAGIEVQASVENLKAPEWLDLSTGYLDAAMGVAANRLSWVGDLRAGGWSVVRREAELLGPIADLGTLDEQGTYTIALSGDVAGALLQGEEITAGPELLGTVVGSRYDSAEDVTNVRMRIPVSLDSLRADWLGREAAKGRFDEVARVRKGSALNTISWVDPSIQINHIYEYKLRAFGLIDETQYSPWSAIRYVRAGDIEAPGPITFWRGYPRLEGRRVNCRFITPDDEDYAGVRVYFRAQPVVGVTTAATLSSLTDSSQTWAVNQFQGYTLHVFSGGLQAEDSWALIGSSDIMTLYTSGGDFPFVPSGGTDFELFYDRPVMTDFGSPSREDQLSFDAIRDATGVLDAGTYIFRTFDFTGNEQTESGDNGAQQWAFSGVAYPRTLVEFEDRDILGGLSTTWVTGFFTVTPEIERIESGTLTLVSGDIIGSVTLRTSGDYIAGDTNHIYARLYPQGDPSSLTPPEPVIRRVVATEAPNLVYLDQGVPSGGTFLIQSGDAFEFYNGATYARASVTRAQNLSQLLPVNDATVFSRAIDPYDGVFVEFYSVVDGLEAEELQTTFVDNDDVAEIQRLILTEPSTNQLYVRIDGWDDDTRYWRCYMKRSTTDVYPLGWPTLTGLKDGPFDERYLRWDDSIAAGSSFTQYAGDGCWYVIAVPVNSMNVDGPRIACTIPIGTQSTCSGGCTDPLSQVFYDVGVQNFDDPSPTTGKNLITWKFTDAGLNPTRLTFRLLGRRLSQATAPSTELSYTYRTTLGVRYIDQDARLGSDARNNELADGTVSVGGEASFVHSGLPVHQDLSAGGVLDIWSYTLEAYDGSTLVDQYVLDYVASYASPSASVQMAFVSAYNAYPGTNTISCDDPYTNAIEWSTNPQSTTFDSLLSFRVSAQFGNASAPYVVLADNLPMQQYTLWYHSLPGWVKFASCTSPMAVAYRYKVELIEAPGTVIDSMVSNWVSDTVYLCDGMPDPSLICP